VKSNPSIYNLASNWPPSEIADRARAVPLP